MAFIPELTVTVYSIVSNHSNQQKISQISTKSTLNVGHQVALINNLHIQAEISFVTCEYLCVCFFGCFFFGDFQSLTIDGLDYTVDPGFIKQIACNWR